MPITQDRVLALLEAGEECIEAIKTLKKLATAAGQAGDYERAYALIFQCTPSTDTTDTLTREREHYNKTSKPNVRKKSQMQRLRNRRRGGEASDYADITQQTYTELKTTMDERLGNQVQRDALMERAMQQLNTESTTVVPDDTLEEPESLLRELNIFSEDDPIEGEVG